jgi:hypothetical protein
VRIATYTRISTDEVNQGLLLLSWVMQRLQRPREVEGRYLLGPA